VVTNRDYVSRQGRPVIRLRSGPPVKASSLGCLRACHAVARHNPVRVEIIDLSVGTGHGPTAMLRIVWTICRTLVGRQNSVDPGIVNDSPSNAIVAKDNSWAANRNSRFGPSGRILLREVDENCRSAWREQLGDLVLGCQLRETIGYELLQVRGLPRRTSESLLPCLTKRPERDGRRRSSCPTSLRQNWCPRRPRSRRSKDQGLAAVG